MSMTKEEMRYDLIKQFSAMAFRNGFLDLMSKGDSDQALKAFEAIPKLSIKLADSIISEMGIEE